MNGRIHHYMRQVSNTSQNCGLSSGSARNALVLVSEYGCPHLFITLTCNAKWPEILSQLVHGQTSFDRPDVTAAVFKSRLDQFKMNLRNGNNL
jgi:hypothetical protein